VSDVSSEDAKKILASTGTSATNRACRARGIGCDSRTNGRTVLSQQTAGRPIRIARGKLNGGAARHATSSRGCRLCQRGCHEDATMMLYEKTSSSRRIPAISAVTLLFYSSYPRSGQLFDAFSGGIGECIVVEQNAWFVVEQLLARWLDVEQRLVTTILARQRPRRTTLSCSSSIYPYIHVFV